MKFQTANVNEFTFSSCDGNVVEYKFTVIGAINIDECSKTIDTCDFLKELGEYIENFGVELKCDPADLFKFKKQLVNAIGITVGPVTGVDIVKEVQKIKEENQRLKKIIKEMDESNRYTKLRKDLVDTLGVDETLNDRQILVKLARLKSGYFEIQRALGMIDAPYDETFSHLKKVINLADACDRADKHYEELLTATRNIEQDRLHELRNLKIKLAAALEISPSVLMMNLDDVCSIDDFEDIIKIISHQTKSAGRKS